MTGIPSPITSSAIEAGAIPDSCHSRGPSSNEGTMKRFELIALL